MPNETEHLESTRSHGNAAIAARSALRCWFGDTPAGLQPLGEGHIHSTWLVSLDESDAVKNQSTQAQRYVLQKINQSVFADPQALMGNLQTLFSAGSKTPLSSYALPRPLPTLSGDWLGTHSEAQSDGTQLTGHWRLSEFVENSRTLQRLSSNAQAELAGRAFGDFQRWLDTLHDVPLSPVIAGFHELPVYLDAFDDALNARRARGPLPSGNAQSLIQQLRARDYVSAQNQNAPAANQTLIHGDCKVNNLLFAADTRRVVAVLDLDTLMHGPWWLDFGDLVRSACCTDEGEFQRDRYSSLAKGFFEGLLGVTVNARSERSAALGLAEALNAPAHMTYMLCIRFLTDHLEGDRYFKVAMHGDNLRRAERQFRLLETLERAETVAFMRGVLSQWFA